MSNEEKNRLHDLRLKHGLGIEVEPHEYFELLQLESREDLELHDSVSRHDAELAVAGV